MNINTAIEKICLKFTDEPNLLKTNIYGLFNHLVACLYLKCETCNL